MVENTTSERTIAGSTHALCQSVRESMFQLKTGLPTLLLTVLSSAGVQQWSHHQRVNGTVTVKPFRPSK